MSKLIFLAGLGTGYILGAKAGREQYSKIADAAKTAWEKPAVQRFVTKVDGAVETKAPLLHSVAETVLTPGDASSDSGSSSDSGPSGDSDSSSDGGPSVTADGTPFSVGSDGTTSGAEGDQYRG
ncbi:hypothetical protein [Planctomonas psychrotolerans]|uniref:hypothetical protein n=1 Tax=Planctomonas psychrotolerans TaxID=2528712 RepID=UPI0012394C4B|nr:hypothetical protein [Planctomonas psychrotolerans]